MTEYQQSLVLNNEKFVYYILHKYKLPIEEYYDVGMIGLCKAAIHFDEAKKCKFGTYAYNIICNELKMEFRKNQREIHPNMIMSINASEDDEDLTYIQIVDPDVNVEDNVIMRITIMEYLNKICSRDQTIINMYMKGCKHHDIGKEVNLSQSYISRIIHKFKIYLEQNLDKF